jgi:hypothetical protein
VTLFVLPPLAGLITIIAIALYIWLLVNFIAVLHGFTSLGMVFVATLMSAFALLSRSASCCRCWASRAGALSSRRALRSTPMRR